MPDNPLLDTSALQPQVPGAINDPTNIQPTFSTGITDTNLLPTTPPGADQGQAQQGVLALMQRLAGMLGPDTPANQDMANRMKSLQYTPEMRAQDQFNKMMGISKKPGDLVMDENRNLVQGPDKTSRNWLKTLMGGVGEISRASVEKGAYVPPMERLRGEATKQYQAESQPLIHELQYGMQDRRNIENNLSTDMKTFVTSVKNADQASVANRNSNLKADIVALAQKFYPEKVAEIRAKTANENNTATLQQLKQQLVAPQMEEVKARTGLAQQQALNAGLTRGLNGDAGAAMAAGNMGVGGKDYMDRLLELNAAKAPKSVMQTPQGPVSFNPKSEQMKPLIPPGAVPNTSTFIGATKPKVVQGQMPGGMPVNVPYDWSSPKENYPQAYALQTLDPRQFKDVPVGHTAENDGIFAYPANLQKKEIDGVGGQKMTPVENALSLLQNGEEFKNILAKIPDSDLGTVMGNLQRAVLGKSDYADPHGYIQALANAGTTVAWAHLASQGSRSAIGAEDIAKHMASLGLNREGILNGLQAWLNQGHNVIRQPENAYDKPLVASLMEKMYPGQGYHKMLEIYDNAYHKKQAAAALARKNTGNK